MVSVTDGSENVGWQWIYSGHVQSYISSFFLIYSKVKNKYIRVKVVLKCLEDNAWMSCCRWHQYEVPLVVKQGEHCLVQTLTRIQATIFLGRLVSS